MGSSFYLPLTGQSYLGKNSSQGIKQPQAIKILPQRQPSDAIHIGKHPLSHPDAGHAYLCSTLSGATGSDMGVNERGVAIVMESPFSKFKAEAEGLSGADYLQAALMSASSAEAAKDMLIALVERYGQACSAEGSGGRAASASYIVSGFDGAYLIETAAKRWAWKALDESTALSDSYTMDIDYKRVDAVTRKSIALVNERMACLDEADAGRVADKESWKIYVEDKGMRSNSGGSSNRRALGSLLEAAAESGTRQAAFALLRVHGAHDPEYPRRPRDICRHESILGAKPSSASMLIERRPKDSRFVVWFTGAAFPCANIFKPILFDGGFKPLWPVYDYHGPDSEDGERYWQERLEANRSLRRSPAKADENAAALAAAQAALSGIVDGLLGQPTPYTESALAKAREQATTIVSSWDIRS